jgi:hypothetical protein
MKAAGLGIRKHTLDNEALDAFKQYTHQQQIQFELVPPGNHRRNKAEHAIQTFKAHFISILAGIDNKFSLSLWCHLLEPTELTLNLLCQSKVAPKISAFAHVHGPHDYMKAICTTWLRNPSPCQTGGLKNMRHTIRCRFQSWHINAAPPMFLGIHHEDMGNEN